jgi:hypothetical protein
VSEDSPEGRFLQVSGASFDADRSLPVGHRVSNVCSVVFPSVQLRKSTDGHRTSIQPNALYTVLLSSFLAKGYDGYEFLKEKPSVRSYHQTEQLTHAELVMRIFKNSLRPGMQRQPESLTNSLLSLIYNCFTRTKYSSQGIRDTQASRPALSIRNWIWDKQALKRARKYLVIGYCEKTRLPIVTPNVDGRIKLVRKA